MVKQLAVRSEVMPRPPRAPLRPRSRRRWTVLAGIAGAWAFMMAAAGSVLAGTVLFLMLAVAAIGLVVAARCLGVSRDHPWVRQLAARPWRDGQDVLQLGLRHLPEAFIVTPSGSLLAPNVVELRMSLADVASLTELMELSLINSSATEVYQDLIAARGIAVASFAPAGVSVIGDPAVPPGRYQLRQGRLPAPAHPPVQAAAGTRDGQTRADPGVAQTVAAGSATVTEPTPVPLLRLVTNGRVAETRVSGARAGRGSGAELGLPGVPTVSRLHATFAFAGGHWQITALGRNGVLLNGTPVTGEQVIRDADTIRWGSQPDALVSRVEIGWDRALPSCPRA
jgi:hypothetical protein